MASNQISEDVLKMIEQKRLQAIELRKRKLEEHKHNQLNKNSFIQVNNHLHTSSASSIPKLNTPLSITATHVANKSNFDSSIQNNKNIFSRANFTNVKNRSDRLNRLESNTNKILENEKSTNNANNSSVKRKMFQMSAVLENAKQFRVSCDYDADIIKIFREVESKRWDPISKNWFFSLSDFYQIFLKIKQLKHLNISFSDSIPETVINALIEQNNRNTKNERSPDLFERLDKKFIEELYDFQKEGIIFGIQHEGRCLIADDMGLGKTIQSIGLAMWYREDWPLIIVCPSSLRFQWARSILQWVDNLSEENIFIVENTKDIFPKVLVTITSYDLMARLKTRFTVETNRFYNMIIMDESHYIKSDVAQRTSTALLIAKFCKRVILLSGTPALSKPIGDSKTKTKYNQLKFGFFSLQNFFHSSTY